MNEEIKKQNNQFNLTKSKTFARGAVTTKTTKLGTKLSFYSAYKVISEFANTGEIPSMISFKISEFLKEMKISSNSAYRKIKINGGTTTAIRSQLNKALSFQIYTPKSPEVLLKDEYDENDYWSNNIFSKTGIDDGKCIFEINEKVFTENFINLEKGDFITTPLNLVAQMKNDYTVRFYEYFKSYVWGYNFAYKKQWDLRELRLLLGLNDFSNYYISNISNLKSRILDPVVKELNSKTDLNVQYEWVKGLKNKVTHIIFEAKLKSKEELDKLNLSTSNFKNLKNLKSQEEIDKAIDEIVNW